VVPGLALGSIADTCPRRSRRLNGLSGPAHVGLAGGVLKGDRLMEHLRRGLFENPEITKIQVTPPAAFCSACDSGSWAGRRPRLGGYVTGTGATRGVPAAGGR